MNRSYQKNFLHRSGHSRSSDTTGLTENIIVPLNEGEIDDQTSRLYSKHQKLPSVSNANAISSTRLVDHSEWQQLSKEGKSRHQESRQSPSGKKLSAVMRQGPISLENGRLSLVGCYLTEIDILPEKLTDVVRILYLSNNSLTSLTNLHQFKYITSLSLANNSIRYLHSLLPLSNLLFLEKLTLEGNIITHMPYYREIVFGICASSQSGQDFALQTLDSIRITSAERTNARVNFRKCCLQIEQMRCNGLRIAILEHMHHLFSCHAEIISSIMGKFRSVDLLFFLLVMI
jgi:hypothetical protein